MMSKVRLHQITSLSLMCFSFFLEPDIFYYDQQRVNSEEKLKRCKMLPHLQGFVALIRTQGQVQHYSNVWTAHISTEKRKSCKREMYELNYKD